jgi:hypothetical protein
MIVTNITQLLTYVIKKDKVVPLRPIEAHLGDRRYSSYSFLTPAPEGGEWSASRPGRALPPVPIVQEAGWAPEPVWTQRLEEKSCASVGDRTPSVQSAVRHCTDWATPAHTNICHKLSKSILLSFYPHITFSNGDGGGGGSAQWYHNTKLKFI